jgi:hypothetical protein
MAKVTNAVLDAEISRMEHKYFQLVWLARKTAADQEDPYLANIIDEVLEGYPEECESLADPFTGDWQHGFHSGMLAALRFVMTAREEGLPVAQDFFPDLDT